MLSIPILGALAPSNDEKKSTYSKEWIIGH
jgi:hypothetical protein